MAATTADFFGIRRRSGVFFNWAAIFGPGADMDFYGLERAPLYPQASEFT
jgi:hypothetical protein